MGIPDCERGGEMPFEKMPGLAGKIYVPEQKPGAFKKHPCPDCFSCDGCSDDRCGVCRDRADKKPKDPGACGEHPAGKA